MFPLPSPCPRPQEDEAGCGPGRVPKSRDSLPLNAIRVFVAISREASVTRAAKSLGITQSSASRHLAVLERYLGARLIERRGRLTSLTDFGRLFAEAVGEPLDAVAFAVQRMRRARVERQRIVVRTSLSTFAFSTLIPNLPDFAEEANGVVVDVITSLAAPTTSDSFDVLVTRDLDVAEPSDHWDLFEEHLVCAGPPALIDGEGASAIRDRPFLSTTSRPDILPRWLAGMAISQEEITLGACYDHYYLALPAVTTGQGLLVAPEILIADLVRQGILGVLAGSRIPSGMRYRAYAVDRSSNPDLSRAFCRWLVRLCKRGALSELDASRT